MNSSTQAISSVPLLTVKVNYLYGQRRLIEVASAPDFKQLALATVATPESRSAVREMLSDANLRHQLVALGRLAVFMENPDPFVIGGKLAQVTRNLFEADGQMATQTAVFAKTIGSVYGEAFKYNSLRSGRFAIESHETELGDLFPVALASFEYTREATLLQNLIVLTRPDIPFASDVIW